MGHPPNPLTLREGGRFLVAFGNEMGHPPDPLTLREGGRFLVALGMAWGIPLTPLRSAKGDSSLRLGGHGCARESRG